MIEDKKKETLLELLDGCTLSGFEQDIEHEDIIFNRASELEALGFDDVAQKMLQRIEMVHKLGKTANQKYIRITPTRIKEYLKMKAERYNKEHPKDKEKEAISLSVSGRMITTGAQMARSDMPAFVDYGYAKEKQTKIKPKHEVEEFNENTNDYYSDNKDTIGRFIYTETPTDQYPDIPPQDVLNTLREHRGRKIFDYFTISKVTHVHDPILFGRIDGCEDRFYICQWGRDITLDDIL